MALILALPLVTGCQKASEKKPESPPGRGYHAMAYDSESRRIVLFGGQTGDIAKHPEVFLSAETWAYDPAKNLWQKMSPPASPPAMSAQAMAYDGESDRVILHGGGGGGGTSKRLEDWILNQTWAYDLNSDTWTKMSDGPPRLGHRMVYDAESDRIVMFGGACLQEGRFREVRETWAYNFDTDAWTEMKPVAVPPARQYHGMAYDKSSDRTILWGGFLGKDRRGAGVWSYDFNSDTWTERTPEYGPETRCYPAMAYDERFGRMIIYGGLDNGNDETWAYDILANTWIRMSPGANPGKLSRMPMVYIPETSQMVVFGGQLDSRQFIYSDETWVYDSPSNAWVNKTIRQGGYLGQKKPGLIPEVFAPRLITPERPVHSSVAISQNGKEIYWSSFFENSIQGVIMSSKWGDRGWTMPKPLSLSDRFDARNPFLSTDGKKLYFFGRKAPADDPSVAYKIWVAARKSGAWIEPRALESSVNSGKWDAGPSVAQDGTLYFTSYRDGSRGMFDIYRAIYSKGSYRQAERLGDEVNSDSWDMYPYIAPDESYILFSSNRPGGAGGQDLYISFSDQDGTWTPAIDMGPAVNSDRDEMFPFVSGDGKTLFFARSFAVEKDHQYCDVYWVDSRVIEELRSKR